MRFNSPEGTASPTRNGISGVLGPGGIKTLAAAAVLALVVLCYFPNVLDGTLLLTERDLSVFFIPPRIMWVETLAGGEIPLWNPYSFSGSPLLATLQPGVFYPVNLLLVLLPFDLAFNWSIIMHFFLAGLFTYLLLLDRGVSATGALAGALSFMLTGYLFSVHNVISTLFTVAWVPLALLFFIRAVMNVSYVYAAFTGLTLAVMFTGGGIEVLFGTVMLFIIITLFPSVSDLTGPRRTVPTPGITQRGRIFITAAVIMALLSAVQLLPFLELGGLSTRAGGLAYGEATTWSFAFKDFLHLFIPDPYGYGADNEKYWSNQSWLKTVYIGTIPFLLAWFHLKREKFRTAPFIFAGLFFLLLAMGSSTFLYRVLFETMPFFKKIRYPVKFLFVPFLFISLAAGSGVDHISRVAASRRAENDKRKKTGWIYLVYATMAAVVLGLLSLYTDGIISWLSMRGLDFPEYNYPAINLFNTKRLVVFFLLACLAIYLGLRGRVSSRVVVAALVVLLGADLFFAHRGYYAVTPSIDYHKPGEVIRVVKAGPELDSGLYRVFATPKTLREGIEVRSVDGSFDLELIKSMSIDKERITGYNLEHRIFDIGGFGVMQRGDYAAVYTMLTAQRTIDATNLLALMNVRYVVSIPEIDSSEFRLVKVIGAPDGEDVVSAGGDDRLLKVYENLNYLPRFFMLRDYRVVTDPKEYATTLPSKDFDPGSLVLLEEEPEHGLVEGAVVTNKPVEVVEYRSNTATVRVDCGPAPCIMVASESFYPGWRATVDGEEAEVLRADYIYRAVSLPAGEHMVSFAYRPSSFMTGAVVSGATVAGLIALALVWFTKRRGLRR